MFWSSALLLLLTFRNIYVTAVVGKCNYNLVLLWSRETGHAPFAAPPVIADVNFDGLPEVIAAPFADQVTVVEGHNGHIPHDSKWPQQLVDSTVHASPMVLFNKVDKTELLGSLEPSRLDLVVRFVTIQYDADSDGKPDILVASSDAHLYFFTSTGDMMNYTIKLPGLQVAKNWSQEQLNVEKQSVHSYILDRPPVNDKAEPGYVVVDPHILGNPVIADMNADNIIEEMVIPVSYYFDDEYYNDPDKQLLRGVPGEELSHYLVGGVVFLNLTSREIISTIHLELTQVDAEYPGYVMFTPTVIDLDGVHGPLETVVGTSAGQIHVFNNEGINRPGWPIAREPVHGQILAADVNLDGHIELVGMDTSGTVMCYRGDGQLVWEATVSGTGTSGPRLADIDQDGRLDVVLGTNDGQVWILEGDDGKVKKQWPFRVGYGLAATPLITQLTPTSVIDVVILAEDAHLHIVSGDGKKCRHAISLGETSLVGVLTSDLVPSAPGLELLVATRDGTLMCLGRRAPEEATRATVVMDAQPADTRSANDFLYSASKIGVVIKSNDEGVLAVTGTSLDLYFDIIDKFQVQGGQTRTYKVNVYLRNKRLVTSTYNRPGSYYLTIPCPTTPVRAVVSVVMTTRHGVVYQDSATLQFNTLFLRDLQWLLVGPFLAMAAVLLLLHGYPAVDLLPITYRPKTS